MMAMVRLANASSVSGASALAVTMSTVSDMPISALTVSSLDALRPAMAHFKSDPPYSDWRYSATNRPV